MVFVIGGLLMIVHPIDMAIFHPPGDGSYDGGNSFLEHVTKEMARYIGVRAILLGVGFASFVLCRSRE